MVGGFWAVSVTDTVQAAIMMVVSVGCAVGSSGSRRWTGRGMGHALSASMPAEYLNIDGGHAGLILLGFAVSVVWSACLLALWVNRTCFPG